MLIPDDSQPRGGQVPGQVRFFHDTMQSYLTARGLFARVHARPHWEELWRAAADPLFGSAPSELVLGSGPELFQMCLQVFGPEERLRAELRRQLREWAWLHDDVLTKRDITRAVPEQRRSWLDARVQGGPDSSARSLLLMAIECCEDELSSLGHFYALIAGLL